MALPIEVAKAAAEKVSKPVWGRKKTLTYTVAVEREGQEVDALVVEERSRQIGTLGLAAIAIGGGLAAQALVNSDKGKAWLEKRKAPGQSEPSQQPWPLSAIQNFFGRWAR